jgi:transcriptional pleiotropic regulator of transition state genes
LDNKVLIYYKKTLSKIIEWGIQMKSTGIVRKVDELGRIVLPIELRRALDLKTKDPVEIFVEEEQIIFKKYTPYNA